MILICFFDLEVLKGQICSDLAAERLKRSFVVSVVCHELPQINFSQLFLGKIKNDSIFAVTLVAFLVKIVSTHFHYFPFHFHYIRFDGYSQMYSHLWDCKLSHSFPIFILITNKRTVVVLRNQQDRNLYRPVEVPRLVWMFSAELNMRAFSSTQEH